MIGQWWHHILSTDTLLPLGDIFLDLLYTIFHYFVSISHFIDTFYHIVTVWEVEEYIYRALAFEQQGKYCGYLSAFDATFHSRLFCSVTTLPQVFVGLHRNHRKMWAFIVFHFGLVSLVGWGCLFLISVPSQPPAQPQPTHLWGNGEELRDKEQERALLLQEHFSAIASTLVCDPCWFSHRCKA